MTNTLKCEICHNIACGVCSSVFGAISHAYCEQCLNSEREVWSTLIAGLMFTSKETVADWCKPYITATCLFYNKSEDELWNEVEKLNKEIDKQT